MAELRHYLTKNIYIKIRLPWQKVKNEIINILTQFEDRTIRFDRQENGTVIYVHRSDGNKISRVYVVPNIKENKKIISWLNSLGY